MFLIAPYYERRAMSELGNSAESCSSFSERFNAFAVNKPLLFRIYMFGLIGAIGFGWAAFYFFLQYGQISTDIVDLDRSQVLSTTDISWPIYVTLTGRMNCDSLYLLEESINASHYLIAYTQIIDTETTLKNVFLENRIYKNEEYCTDKMISIKGIMRSYGLPGMVYDEYIDQGIINPDEKYMTIEYDAKPGEMNGLIWGFLFLAVVSFITFLFIHIRKRPLA